MRKHAVPYAVVLIALGAAGCANLTRSKMILRNGGRPVSVRSLSRVMDDLDDLVPVQDDQAAAAIVYLELARAWCNIGCDDRALALLASDASKTISQVRESKNRAWLLKELAVGHARAHDYANARKLSASNQSTKQRQWGLMAIVRVQAQQAAPAEEIQKTLKVIKDAEQQKWALVDAVKVLSGAGQTVAVRNLIERMSNSKSQRDWLLKESAIAMADANHYADAEDVMKEIKDDKQAYWVRKPLARAYARQGNVAKALELAEESGGVNDRAWACWAVAKALPSWVSSEDVRRCLQSVSKHVEAVADVEQRQGLLELVGNMFADKGMNDEAKTVAVKIEKTAREFNVKDGRPEDLLRAIRIFHKAGDETSAARVLKHIEAKSRAARGRGRRRPLLIDAYVAMGKYVEAEKRINSRPLRPGYAAAWVTVFEGRLRDRQYDEAFKLVSRLKAYPQRSEILRPLGQVLIDRRDIAGIDKLAAMLTRDDRDKLYLNLIVSLSKQGRMPEAVTRLDRVTADTAKSNAMAAIALGHWDKGETGKSMQLLAYMPSRAVRVETARKIFQRLVAKSPRSAGKWPASAASIKLRLDLLRGCAMAIADAMTE